MRNIVTVFIFLFLKFSIDGKAFGEKKKHCNGLHFFA